MSTLNYKRYLFDKNAKVPRSTIYRRRKKEAQWLIDNNIESEQPLDDILYDHTDIHLEEAIDNVENNLDENRDDNLDITVDNFHLLDENNNEIASFNKENEELMVDEVCFVIEINK
jgi:hypothetical protein